MQLLLRYGNGLLYIADVGNVAGRGPLAYSTKSAPFYFYNRCRDFVDCKTNLNCKFAAIETTFTLPFTLTLYNFRPFLCLRDAVSVKATSVSSAEGAVVDTRQGVHEYFSGINCCHISIE